MCSLNTARFCKQITCPPAETLLLCHETKLMPEEHEQIAAHLAACDFCGAELQLLVRHPPTDVAYVKTQIPDHLRLLAEELLGSGIRGRQRTGIAIYEKDTSIDGGQLALIDA